MTDSAFGAPDTQANALHAIIDTVIGKLEDGRVPWLVARPTRSVPRGLPYRLLPFGSPAAARLRCFIEDDFHELFAATGMASQCGAIRTFYSLDRDTIILSDWRDRDATDFYRDWIHELLHATGHPSRLGRDLPATFGSHVDAYEDLVAEMGSVLVCESLGIEPALRHPQAFDAWSALLRADRGAYGRAADAAQAAAGYLFALRDAQAASFDRLEAEEKNERRESAAVSALARRLRREEERQSWAFGRMTGSRPGESLQAIRRGDQP